jgi:hypothetical protein
MLEMMVLLCACAPVALYAQGPDSASSPLLEVQATAIYQHLNPFSRQYDGPNSLTAQGDDAATHTYGAYLGLAPTGRLHLYLDVEMARGSGIGRSVGLAGLTNGDVIRQGTLDLGQDPYIARAFFRYIVPLSAQESGAKRGMDQVGAPLPAQRLELKLGKLAANDDFDQNRYANNTRTQFMNWGLINNSAWDFAADTRGYTHGVLLAWITPDWALRVGSYQMPREANGNALDPDIARARGDNLELTLPPTPAGTVARLLAYENHGRMGDYAQALADAGGRAPSARLDEQPGRTKVGYGINIEQPLADVGESGLFLRWGWNDGRTEDFAYTEVDGHLSIGLQVAGNRWGREADRAGLAVVAHELSAPHRDYLAAGGTGFLLGDGRLRYGSEQIAEFYYRAQIGSWVQVAPDVQYIVNPGYNRDRGPAGILSLRVRASY